MSKNSELKVMLKLKWIASLSLQTVIKLDQSYSTGGPQVLILWPPTCLVINVDYCFKLEIFVKYSMILWNALKITSMTAY